MPPESKPVTDASPASTKPGRKAGAPAPLLPAAVATAAAQDLQAADTVAALQAGYEGERDLVNQLLGQAQAFQAAGQLLQTFGVSKLAYVKEHRLYQRLAGTKMPNGLELKGTWAGFCGLLGVSDEKANQDIANLQTFGEAALDQMQRMGIGYRDLRQYRRLPEGEQQALIEAAKSGDKDGFLDLAETLVARHAAEKKALADQLTAKEQVLAKKAERMQALEAELEAATAAPALATDALDKSTAAVSVGMYQLMNAVDAALDAGGGADEALQLRARQCVEFLCQQLADLAVRYDVAIDLEQRVPPPWLNAEALAALEARDQAAEAGPHAAETRAAPAKQALKAV